MTLRMMSALSIHDVRTIEAKVADGGPLTIELGTGNYREGQSEIVIYLDNVTLSKKIADAINDVVAWHNRLPPIEPKVDPASGHLIRTHRSGEYNPEWEDAEASATTIWMYATKDGSTTDYAQHVKYVEEYNREHGTNLTPASEVKS